MTRFVLASALICSGVVACDPQTPTPPAAGVPVLPRVVAGDDVACVLTAEGHVRCWGSNNNGVLGLGDLETRGDEPDEIGTGFIDLGTDRTAVQLSLGHTVSGLGGGHACAVLDDQTVKCWGSNGDGQLGLGDTRDRGDDADEMGDVLSAVDVGGPVAQVITAEERTCVLMTDGRVKCWGASGPNAQGVLGYPSDDDVGDEAAEMGQALPDVELGGNAVRIAGHGDQTCALLENGALKCFGMNLNGTLGLGDTESRGDDPGEMGNALSALSLGTGTVASFDTDADSCVAFEDGSVKCWGLNLFGASGQGDTESRGGSPGDMGNALPPVRLGTDARVVEIQVRGSTACVLLEGGRMKCWGANGGALGAGDTEHRGDDPNEMGDALLPIDLGADAVVTSFSLGDFGVCALLDDERIKCWGDNQNGALGLGDTENRGDEPGEMGDALPSVKLEP